MQCVQDKKVAVSGKRREGRDLDGIHLIRSVGSRVGMCSGTGSDDRGEVLGLFVLPSCLDGR